MGCDIHLTVERRETDGMWHRVGASDWYDDRDYDLFAILAGVRNNNDIVPVAEARGLPDDCVHAGEGEWQSGYGDHSYSWLDLPELLAFDWSQVATISGTVCPPDDDTDPDEWAAKVRKGAEMEGHFPWALAGGYSRAVYGRGADRYRRVEWQETYFSIASRFLERVVLRMVRESNGDLGSMRIVFGFDS